MRYDATGNKAPEAPVPPSESSAAAVEAPTRPGEEVKAIVQRRNALDVNKRYRLQFGLVYGALALIGIAAVIGFVVLVIQPAQVRGPSWSEWKPKSGGAANMTKQVADHVSAKYRLSAGGSQLLAILTGPPQITSGADKIPIEAIAIRKAPQSNNGLRILYTKDEGMQMVTLCGMGPNCSIAEGTPSAARGRLVRREALETALYTFKYVPAVKSIVAFLPPPPGEQTTSVLLFEKDAFKEQLSQPLTKTLPLTTPPLPSESDEVEAATIDKLTLSHLYSYELTALQTGGAAMFLDPAA